jgi:phosphoenolpyruvate carboxykinase (ATP)
MPCDLRAAGITVERLLHNLSPAALYEAALARERGSSIASTGALIALSGAKTGRSPGDKRVVRHPDSQDHIWWGAVNIAIPAETFQTNRERAIDYLNTREELHVVDGYAGWDPRYRLKIRVICARAYHALFMRNLLIRPSEAELAAFGQPDFTIYNAGRFPANSHTPGMTSKTSIDISFEEREMVILGTEYAGEMKKGVFTIMNYLMPKAGHLSMHCSCTEARGDGSSSVLFGLSGTGKTTLSADPKRLLIGDDEHVWTDQGVFNIEGGCYAKAIALSEAKEPEIWQAIRFGTVLENVVYAAGSHRVDYDDVSITENTRAAYPIEHIASAKLPCLTGHPKDVIFLTCDAFGVLPPVSKLTPEQAMYHFVSGYTAKVAGTEVGITEPKATFSSCFGGPFLAWPPATYAKLLAEKLQRHRSQAWLVNTGWSGGGYGQGRRMPLSATRAILDAIHDGSLVKAITRSDPVFGLAVPTACRGVDPHLLWPAGTWPDPAAYASAAAKLAGLFRANAAKNPDLGLTVGGPVG